MKGTKIRLSPTSDLEGMGFKVKKPTSAPAKEYDLGELLGDIGPTTSQAKRDAIREYRRKNYKTLSLDYREEELDEIRAKAKEVGLSMRELVLRAVREY